MTKPPEVYYRLRLRELQAFYRLPGYLFCESLMAFWGCNRSVVSSRLSRINELELAVVRSECHAGSRRWYWIDPYPPEPEC